MAASAILNFAVGETSKQVLITLRDDLALEGNEAFTVVLSQPTGETTLGALNRMTVTLVDNEGGAGAVVDGIHVSRRRPEGKAVPELRFAGPAGSQVRLESSTNMTPWVTRETLTLEAGEAVWTEPEDAEEGRSWSRRHQRIIEAPKSTMRSDWHNRWNLTRPAPFLPPRVAQSQNHRAIP